MYARTALAVFLCSASPVLAACAVPGGTVLSCTTGGGAKALDVCIAGSDISYRYGPRGAAPELSLNAHVAQVEHQPWPGIGRTIWENTTFRNGSYAYEVYAAFDKIDQTDSGGVTVYRGGSEIASVTCDPGSVTLGMWAVSDAKQAHGVCWDLNSHSWGRCD